MKHRGTLIRLCCLLSSTLVGVGAAQRAGGAPPEYLQQLASAEARWAANKPEAYEFRVQPACNGLIPPNPPQFRPPLIRVSAGQSTMDADRTSPMAKYDTVEKQFAFIRTAWDSKPLRVEVQYDQRRGYPIRVCVDPGLPTDDEFGFLLTDFRVVADVRRAP
jgi:hypothetical protein